MKKTLKIAGITLASLVGLVLIVVVVAAMMLTSSGRLTKMVNKYAPRFITCEFQLGKADLTLFKTFPNVGIDIENVALINPMAGSPTDTLANIDNLIVVVDAKKLWKEKEIAVRKCILEDAFVNLYTDTLGQSNLNIFNKKEDSDTTSSFDYLVNIEEVKLKHTNLIYTDDRNGMRAYGKDLNLDLKGSMNDKDIDAALSLHAADLSLKMKSVQLALTDANIGFDGNIADFNQIDGSLQLTTPDANLDLKETYLKHDTLRLDLPLQFNVSNTKAHLNQAQIGLNRMLINLDGDAEVAENSDINLDISLGTNKLIIENVLSFLPEKVQQRLNSLGCSGDLRIVEAKVKGTYNDSLMPLITAKVLTERASLNLNDLPYPLTNIQLDADLDLDLNSEANSVVVNSLKTNFNRSELNVSGLVDQLLGDIGLQLKVNGTVPMTDIKSFLPTSMRLGGKTTIDLTTNFTVEQLRQSLKNYNFNPLSANGTLKIKDFSFDMDTIHATSPLLNVDLTLPASAKAKGRSGVYVSLASSTLQAQVGKGIRADLKQPDIKLSADNFKSGLEKMLLNAALDFSHLELTYDTITAQMDTPSLTVTTTPVKNGKGLKAQASVDGRNITANMGKGYALNSNLLTVNASVNENKDKTDFLNHWNPQADFTLGNATVQIAGLDEDVRISNIDFLFNSSKLDFKNSTFRIGQSDLSLQGNVVGIKEWIEDHKNLMKGNLQLTSDILNINEIMDLTSGLGREESETAKGDDSDLEDNPFMVPEGIDFTFGINAKKSLIDNFDLNDLGGSLTVKDGTLILQEIGFTNKAAEMQLTALYQSPRKNNLFLALDFHLLDVQIGDLLDMVPFIDTLVPMLKTFDGQAEFHIGAETNLKSNYEPKISTLRAAADIEGKNLTVKDRFTFTKITDMLDVSTNGEYRVDNLDVQITAFKNEIDLWPSQIAIGKYKVTVDGRMTLDKKGEYHLSVTESPLPTRLGLKVSGPFNNLKFDLESCKYPNLYKPNKRNDREQMYIDLKKRIADRLKENVR